MSAIERCRSAALGGHVLRCAGCGRDQIAYNSCRNRHCPKCQAPAARRWLAAREADLLPVEYYHVVFTLPAPIAELAYQNKAVIYGLLFDVAAATLLHDRRRSPSPGRAHRRHPRAAHLGFGVDAPSARARHCPGRRAVGRWPAVDRLPAWLLPAGARAVRLFRRRFCEELLRLHGAGRLQLFNHCAALADPAAFARWLAPLRRSEWVVYAKRPFAGPAAVLAYLSRYTHRVAISNSRLLRLDDRGVTFRWKDYRSKGSTRRKTMTLAATEFIRRFLLHVLPSGFHRIRHYGLLANAGRVQHLATARRLLQPTTTT